MTEPQLNIPLKPCPFAREGETHEVAMYPTGYGHSERWIVMCSCSASGPDDLGESGAAEAWNTRPTEARLLEVCKTASRRLNELGHDASWIDDAIAAAEGAL